MVSLTERAAEHVLALMRDDPEAFALRVAVQGGGCSGLQYALGFDGEPQPGDEVVDQHGVKIVGHKNVAGRLAADSSALFSRNLYNFLSAFWDKEKGAPVLDARSDSIGRDAGHVRGSARFRARRARR